MIEVFTDWYAAERFRQLVNDFAVKTAVETGTYKADSTLRIAELVDQVYSIEIKREYYEESVARLIREGFAQAEKREHVSLHIKGRKEITLFRGDSPGVISEIIEYLKEPIIFYLDAHSMKPLSEQHWPIKDEIRAIKPKPNSLIAIHDFRVPGKPFGFDVYQGQPLDYDYVKDDLAYVNPNYMIIYNEKAAGTFRGILYALPRS